MRSLVEERNRRITAERHVEQLRQELRRLIDDLLLCLAKRSDWRCWTCVRTCLQTELREVKTASRRCRRGTAKTGGRDSCN